MPDPKTMQQVVEQFQTAYILEDEPRSGRPCNLSKADHTKLKEHMDENPGLRSTLLKNLVTNVKQYARR